MVYEWRDGARYGLDAQKVGGRLARIQAKHGGVTAELVVKDAQAKSSPLHGGFEWDDKRAAHLHRLQEARSIIRSIVVHHPTTESDERRVRAFVHVNEEYEDVVTVLSVADKREVFLAQALAEAKAWRCRYEHLEELAGVFAALEKATAA